LQISFEFSDIFAIFEECPENTAYTD